MSGANAPKFCPECGAAWRAGAGFCVACGKRPAVEFSPPPEAKKPAKNGAGLKKDLTPQQKEALALFDMQFDQLKAKNVGKTEMKKSKAVIYYGLAFTVLSIIVSLIIRILQQFQTISTPQF